MLFHCLGCCAEEKFIYSLLNWSLYQAKIQSYFCKTENLFLISMFNLLVKNSLFSKFMLSLDLEVLLLLLLCIIINLLVCSNLIVTIIKIPWLLLSIHLISLQYILYTIKRQSSWNTKKKLPFIIYVAHLRFILEKFIVWDLCKEAVQNIIGKLCKCWKNWFLDLFENFLPIFIQE